MIDKKKIKCAAPLSLNAETVREYDGLIGLTLLNIHTLSKRLGTIRLLNFNRKNKEHLYMLRIALTARDIYQMPVEIDCSWWDYVCVNWKIRKGFNKVKHANARSTQGIRTYEVLDFMRPDGICRLGEQFKFSDIYCAYYDGSLD